MSFDAVIDVQNVSKRFGGLRAVNNCSLRVARGSITGLIGPNGAGKSTLFNLVAGNIAPDSGKIVFDGQDVTGLKPHQLFHRGMLRTFQIAHEFSNMTALENLMMVPDKQPGESLLTTWIAPGTVKDAERHVRQKALDVIDFLKLGHVKHELAGNLSGGQKKLLELGRVMMVNPRLVLLDEPFAGVNAVLIEEIIARLRDLHARGIGFWIIEHDLEALSDLVNEMHVLDRGRILASGPPRTVLDNALVREAYLGGAIA